jgi:hypothetical protein
MDPRGYRFAAESRVEHARARSLTADALVVDLAATWTMATNSQPHASEHLQSMVKILMNDFTRYLSAFQIYVTSSMLHQSYLLFWYFQ